MANQKSIICHVLISVLLLFSATYTYPFNIVGTWKLVSLEKYEHGKWVPDCAAPTGLILYSASGYMAAGLNCMRPNNPIKPSFDQKDMTFYTGKYRIDGNTVTHTVLNANNASLYGKNLKREIQIINDSEMNLLIHNNDHTIRIQWKKLTE